MASCNGGCATNATCTNTPGSRACTCPSGYATADGGVTCTDIDECLANNGGCSAAATCTNTPGSRTCTCAAGYTTTNQGVTCIDIDECLTNHGGCAAEATCTNTVGSRICSCSSGYATTDNGVTCTDVDECLANNGGCSAAATCTNTPGSRSCTCNTGWSGPGVTCVDIDECLVNHGGCNVNATCTNTPGSRTCTCNAGYEGSGVACTDIDDCKPNPCANGGTCKDHLLGFTCTCATDYYDPTCSTYDPPPAPVTGFTYSEHGRVGLHWKPPADADWRGVQIVRKAGSAPGSPTDGTVVYDGRARSVFDATAVVGTTYHYAAYAYDLRGTFSAPSRIAFAPSWIVQRFTASGDVTHNPAFPYFTVHAWGAGGGGSGAFGGGGGYATSHGEILPAERWRAMVGRRGDFRGTGGYNGTEDIGRGGPWYDGAQHGPLPSGGQMSGFFRKPVSGVPRAISEWSVIAGGGAASGSIGDSWPGGGGGSVGGGLNPGRPGADGVGGASGSPGSYTLHLSPGAAFADGGHGGGTNDCSYCGGPGGGGYGGGGAGGTLFARMGFWCGGGGGGSYARNANGLAIRTTSAGAHLPAEDGSPFYPTDGTNPGRGGPPNSGGHDGYVVVVLTRCPGNLGGPTCSDGVTGSGPVTNLRASAGTVVLDWQLPPDAVDAIRIVRSTTGYVTTPDDGTLVVDLPGTETSFADTTTTPGVYHYSVFTRNAAGLYSSATNIESEMCTVCRFSESRAVVVPPGMTNMTVKVWGAGGGGGNNYDSGYRAGFGGGGGFSSSTTAVSSGEVFRAIVGGAGSLAFIEGIGEGFNGVDSIGVGGGTTCIDGGTGGQMSGVVRTPLFSTTPTLQIGDWLAIAGGGGGGHGGTWTQGRSGGGGGTMGRDGEVHGVSGRGGGNGLGGERGSHPDQYAAATSGSRWVDGGQGGSTNGLHFAPQRSCGGSGGGGYGGGGGGVTLFGYAGGGGGGGGYVPSGGTTIAGDPWAPANTEDPDYPTDGSDPGFGGYPVVDNKTAKGLGCNGYVVIRFQ